MIKSHNKKVINKPSKHSSWWRRFEDVLKTSFVLAFRGLLQDVFKTSSSRRIYSPYSYVFRRRLQDVLIKTNILVLIIRLQDVFKMSCQDVFKTSSRRLQDVLKTFWRRLQDIHKTFPKRLQDVFRTSWRRLQDVLRDVFKTSLQDVLPKIATLKMCWRRLQDQQMFAGKDAKQLKSCNFKVKSKCPLNGQC